MNSEAAKQAIEKRNIIRQRAGLPLLDPKSELMKTLHDAENEAYSQFYYKVKKDVEDKIMAECKAVDPNYKIDSFMQSVAFGNKVHNMIKEMWRKENGSRI